MKTDMVLTSLLAAMTVLWVVTAMGLIDTQRKLERAQSQIAVMHATPRYVRFRILPGISGGASDSIWFATPLDTTEEIPLGD